MYLGIDIGGTNVSFGLVNKEGQITFSGKFATSAVADTETCLQKVLACIKDNIPEHYTLDGVGIGAPMLTSLGILDGAVNIPWPQPVVIKDEARKIFNVPVFTDNDANCSLIGEWKFGQLQSVQHGVMVTLGTGIGGGLLLNGKPFSGAHGYAGEIGHVIYQPEGRLCKCGRKGCYERYIAADGIVITYQEMKSNFPDSILIEWEKNHKIITPKTIYDAALLEDKLALGIYEATAQILAELCITVVCTYNPERIVLFGGILLAGNYLTQPMLHHFQSHLLSIYAAGISIHFSNIDSSDMGILGAAALNIY